MLLAYGQSQSIRSLFRDEYEDGFQKPCTATEYRISIEPAELATVAADTITWASPGTGKIRGEVVYADGVIRKAAGELVLNCGEPPAEIIKTPSLVQAIMVDPDA